MPLFVKRPIIVEAVQWTGDNEREIETLNAKVIVDGKTLFISTLEGVMSASVGDWIIKGIAGECYPCKPEIFDATYERKDT